MPQKSRIIVIGGTYGVGKTSAAHQLSADLDIRQRGGLDVITDTMKAFLKNSKLVANLSRFEDVSKQALKNKLHRESKFISKAINTIIGIADKTGESFIIEGVQILPEFLPLDRVQYCVLKVSDSREHQQRFESPSLMRFRHYNNANFGVVKKLEEVILSAVEQYKAPIFDNVVPLEQTVLNIRKYFSLV